MLSLHAPGTSVMLIVAERHPHSRDIGELKTEALQVLALAYRWPLNWH